MSIIVYGKNTVREAVKSKNALSIKVNPKYGRDPIITVARNCSIPVEFASEDELTRMAKNSSHQGFVAICKDFRNYSLEEIITSSKSSTYPLLLMLDGIEDPHNLGAILRSADAFGVDGIIIKNRNEAPLNATVAKVSTGAISYVKVATVTNLTKAILKLQENGFWVVSADGSGKSNIDEIDYKCPICLVVGSEGFGISRLVLSKSDFVAKIDMVGHVNSLNASVATGILLSHIFYSRK